MDKLKRPFKMIVAGNNQPERVAYEAAQAHWGKVYLISDREGTPLWNTPGIIHNTLPLLTQSNEHSLIIFEKCRSVPMDYLARGRLCNISMIVVDITLWDMPRWCRLCTDYTVFTSTPRPADLRRHLRELHYAIDIKRQSAEYVLKRTEGRVIMSDPINWDSIAFLVNLSEVHSMLIHLALKRFDCTCGHPRPPVMEVLTRNYNIR